MTYTVAKITTQDGVFFTARSDNRTPKEVVADGISGYQAGNRAAIYESLNRWGNCLVEDQATGLTEEAAKELKKALIIVARSQGYNVLNAAKQ
jgi:hypothetical protein